MEWHHQASILVALWETWWQGEWVGGYFDNPGGRWWWPGPGCSGGSGEKWSDSGWVLKTELTWLAPSECGVWKKERKMTPGYLPLEAQGKLTPLGRTSRCELWVGLWGGREWGHKEAGYAQNGYQAACSSGQNYKRLWFNPPLQYPESVMRFGKPQTQTRAFSPAILKAVLVTRPQEWGRVERRV